MNKKLISNAFTISEIANIVSLVKACGEEAQAYKYSYNGPNNLTRVEIYFSKESVLLAEKTDVVQHTHLVPW
jgi:hypothetical protein